MNSNSFTVYNASAGSGKTFTLVKVYLKTLFTSYNKDKYRHILAITFTNKAVAEMKERIITSLKLFSDSTILENTVTDEFKDAKTLLSAIAEELKVTPLEIHKRAVKMHDAILSNYAAFDIVTIDTFTHRVIRTFAHDLKIPQNFEVALETEDFLEEAVNNVISKIGEDPKITKLLVDYAVQKSDEDKSWDISLDIFKTAKLLLNENQIPHLQLLENKTITDFTTLKTLLNNKKTVLEADMQATAKDMLSRFEELGITPSEIKPIHAYFSKLSKGSLNVKYDGAVWQRKLLSGETIYAKSKTSDELASVINTLQKTIADCFSVTKELFFEHHFTSNFLKHLIPLSVLNEVYKSLQQIQEEQNIILISDFNKIISDEIKQQPAPFIYERIGERYQNYFIDEFQDTSEMQWQNLMPLAENALLSEARNNEQNSLMIVGDAKQAIYRWRGGKPEQFIDLYEDEEPFYLKKKVENLDTNYRSYSEIIGFNNEFFTHISAHFVNETHQELYKIGNDQNTNNKKGGYVNLSFIKDVSADESILLYQEKVLEIIENVLKQGFCLADICVVTNKRKEGVAIADYLSEQGISIISSETLLLSKSEEVQFIIKMLRYLATPNQRKYAVDIAHFLYKKLEIKSNEHQFCAKLSSLDVSEMFNYISKHYQLHFDYSLVQTMPLYELVSQIVRSFLLVNKSNAHVHYFLDEVLLFTQKKTANIPDFLDFWELKKEKLSIVAPQGVDAVNIMTVHKSKGLEFPIVIYPFAEKEIYKEIEPKAWLPIDPEMYNGFTEAYISYGKLVENYGESGKILSEKRDSQLQLDALNVLYVALTRPKEQLYIISAKKIIKKTGNENLKRYSGLFINYLKKVNRWEDAIVEYEFGAKEKRSKSTVIAAAEPLSFISESRLNHNLAIVTKSACLWDTDQEAAIEKGNLIHLILSKITYKRDISIVFQELILAGTITQEQQQKLEPIITDLIQNTAVSEYFTEKYTVYNEQPILLKTGNISIPDRVVIVNNVATIIDYKTGTYSPSHEQQVIGYAMALQEMDYKIDKKILIYLSEEIKIVEVI